MATYTTTNIGSGFSIVNPIIDAPKVILNGQKIFAGWTKKVNQINNQIENYPSDGANYYISPAGEFGFVVQSM